MDKSIAFAWKPNVWYSMRLTVQPSKDGKSAAIKGKVWEKSGKEPAEWTITFEDPVPNTEGAGGLYGYATGIEEKEPGTTIYYANVKLTPNKKTAPADGGKQAPGGGKEPAPGGQVNNLTPGLTVAGFGAAFAAVLVLSSMQWASKKRSGGSPPVQ